MSGVDVRKQSRDGDRFFEALKQYWATTDSGRAGRVVRSLRQGGCVCGDADGRRQVAVLPIAGGAGREKDGGGDIAADRADAGQVAQLRQMAFRGVPEQRGRGS